MPENVFFHYNTLACKNEAIHDCANVLFHHAAMAGSTILSELHSSVAKKTCTKTSIVRMSFFYHTAMADLLYYANCILLLLIRNVPRQDYVGFYTQIVGIIVLITGWAHEAPKQNRESERFFSGHMTLL